MTDTVKSTVVKAKTTVQNLASMMFFATEAQRLSTTSATAAFRVIVENHAPSYAEAET